MSSKLRHLFARLRRALFGLPAYVARTKADPRGTVEVKKNHNSSADDAGR